MTYTIQVSGHNVTDTAEAAKQLEEQIQAKAKAFAASLDGVQAAMMEGQHTGVTDLMPPPPVPAAEPAPTEGA